MRHAVGDESSRTSNFFSTLHRRAVRHARLEGNRFYLTYPYADKEAAWGVKRIEGRRFHKELRTWSVPASLRAWKKLQVLNFSMMSYGGGRKYLESLQAFVSGYQEWPGMYDYQSQGISWLRERQFSLLNDEPGLGKTPQAVWAAHDHKRVLVIAPKIVVPQWQKWIGTVTAQEPLLYAETLPEEGWMVTNYERLGRLKVGNKPFTLIGDEIHYIKNPRTARSKLVLSLGERADQVIALTGTRVVNRPVELWSSFLLLRQRDKGEFFPWALRYTGAEETAFGWDFSGATHLDELADDMHHFTLRRTAEEVGLELPQIQEEQVVVEDRKRIEGRQLDELGAAVLDLAGRGFSLLSGEGMAATQRLRIAASQVKLPATIEWVASRGPDQKTIIFFEFKDPLRAVASALSEHWGVAVITGDETDEEKEHAKQWFLTDPDCSTACVTYGAAGTGVDLYTAGTVVLHDLPWTYVAKEQAIARARRIGNDLQYLLVVTMLSGSRVEAQMAEGIEEKADIGQKLQPSTSKVT